MVISLFILYQRKWIWVTSFGSTHDRKADSLGRTHRQRAFWRGIQGTLERPERCSQDFFLT